MAKYLLIVAVVISLITAGLGFVNRGKLTQTKEELDSTRSTLVTTQKSLQDTKQTLTGTKTNLDEATAEKEKTTADLTAAQSELTTAKAQIDTAQKAAGDKDAQIAAITAERDKLLADSVNTGPKPDGNGTVAPDPRIAELEALVASLEQKAKDNDAQLVTLKEKEKSRQEGMMRQGLEGRVLAVNPAWNFVVISIGDREGVVNNAEMLLKRGGQYLGKVRITSVEPSTSIADIVANTLPSGVAVQPGDSVIFPQTAEN